MAGFFGFFDYTKPGPGVPKDAPPKARIRVFFEVLGRKFWNLVKANILFTLFNLPAIIAVMLATHFIFQGSLLGNISDAGVLEGMSDEMSEMFLDEIFVRFALGSILVCIPVITVGPAQAGFTYILRNYSREEHAFLWWDFKDTALQNFKQSLVISVLDFVLVLLFGIAINFYLTMDIGSIVSGVATGFLIMCFIIFLMMHMYIYPMLVTFNLTVKQLYKNSFIFALAKFFPNLGMLIICFIILQATFYYLVIGIILFILLTSSIIGLIVNFYTYPKLKKYIIDKLPGEDGDGDEEDRDEDEDYEAEQGESDSMGDI